MLLLGFALREEVRAALFVLFDPLFRKAAVADLRQQLFHFVTRLLRDDARPGGVVTVLGGVADRIAHITQPAAVNQVHDEFQLVQTFKIRYFGLVSRSGQSFKSGFDQFTHATAKNSLLAEEIGFRFLGESGFQDSSASTANAARVGKREFLGLAGSILLDRQKTWSSAAFREDFSHAMARSFWRD